MMSREKIQPEHLARPAFVYVRQSTLGQVRHHHESQRLQYGLADHARALGWREVVVIDEDLGKSGASAAGRVGFQRLVATVGLGQAGAIFGSEVSRLARNNRDWYQLLDLCGLLNTLIIDTEGIYDPRQLNDRLLLGLKGTIAEAELGWLRQRAQAGLLAKAHRGELVLGLPVGYVRTPEDRVEKDPDQRVQQAIALVFERFAALGSARQVLLWCRQEEMTLPVVTPDGAGGVQTRWRLPVYSTILRFLQNPIYAGAYAFGRTGTHTHIEDGRPCKRRGRRQRRDEWTVLLRDHHEPYIPWDRYERHQQMLADNTNMRGAMAKGAVRRGESLVAGLLRCGHCGRRLQVVSTGARTGPSARYQCGRSQLTTGLRRGCVSVGALRVDEAIEREVLRVVAPGAIEAAVDAADQADTQTDTTRRALELELRQARYEAERAQRQYDAVEPENRLVGETLERRWNAALSRVTELDQRLATLAPPARPVPVDRAQLRALADDFPAVWRSPTTDIPLKKRIVRLLIEEIVATATAEPPQVALVMHWKGGKHSQLVVRKNRAGGHRYCTDRAVIDVVRDLARSLPDGEIARILNRLGYRTGQQNSWTAGRIASLRYGHQIPAVDRTASASFLTIADAATALGVSPMTVRRLVIGKVLPATQPVPYAPWTIRREDLAREQVQRAAEAVKKGRGLPQPGSENQLTLSNSQT
jgi:DNA invertase Pin-like site-specific DNA recombinase